ncbi:M23 family metallopeptidase [Nocardia sp. XZ_19_385]|uniref:M23 family metallopeptidase n=1 Tax=Nocardia sp. XZ_19_385 TaxID=2769488 RepID=UPI0018902637|nr:M23 family metallopeptidase [Nocardia sp. XZ_19_385]
MNHRSTLASGNRARSGHRYREDNEPLAVADTGRRSFPSSNSRYAAAAPAAAEPAHQQYDDYSAYDNGGYDNNGWSTNNEWAQQDSWSDGGAWAANDNADNGWTPEPENNWAPAADDEWVPDAGADWTPDNTGAWAPESTEIPALNKPRRGGAHRMPAPPAALKGRAAVVAVAAGAVVAAGQCAMASPEQPSQSIDYEASGQIHEIAAQSVSLEGPGVSPVAPQVLNVSAPTNFGQFSDILEKGRKYAEELAAAEAAKLRPLFAKFAAGNYTSGYGARWGVQHLGIDVAGPIGTPIYAVADGTVIEAGPAAGFGMWVRLLHDDGTVTIYGHIDTATVYQGQRVMAGDQIATMGNRGFSTGPHVHFEVWLNGVDKVDPVPWLATRGIGLGVQRD